MTLERCDPERSRAHHTLGAACALGLIVVGRAIRQRVERRDVTASKDGTLLTRVSFLLVGLLDAQRDPAVSTARTTSQLRVNSTGMVNHFGAADPGVVNIGYFSDWVPEDVVELQCEAGADLASGSTIY